MSVEFVGREAELARPETSKRSRASSRQNRVQGHMRSTSINFSRDPPDYSPAAVRKKTLDRRRAEPSPDQQQRPFSQQQGFRTGMTLQQFMTETPATFEQDFDEFNHKEDQFVLNGRENFRIEELNEDEEEENRRTPAASKQNLQQRSTVVQRPIVKPTLPYQYKDPPPRSTKRNTTSNFYPANHKRVNSNIEKFEAGQEYLLRKYAEKFQLNEQSSKRRVDSVIHKISNETLAKIKHKFGRFT